MNRLLSAITLAALLTLALAALPGCLPPATFYAGKTVAPDLHVPLGDESRQTGAWQTFEVEIAYAFGQAGGTLDLEGEARLGDHYRHIYDRLDSFDLYLVFLDDQGVVLESAALVSAVGGTTEQILPFRLRRPLPPGSNALSFVYRGGVSERDGWTRFDNLPAKSAPR